MIDEPVKRGPTIRFEKPFPRALHDSLRNILDGEATFGLDVAVGNKGILIISYDPTGRREPKESRQGDDQPSTPEKGE